MAIQLPLPALGGAGKPVRRSGRDFPRSAPLLLLQLLHLLQFRPAWRDEEPNETQRAGAAADVLIVSDA
jgi:hypothetical protein